MPLGRLRRRLPAPPIPPSPVPCRAAHSAVRRIVVAAAGAAVVTVGLFATAPASARTAHAGADFDSALFSLINQDRAQNGLPALRWNQTLSGIGEGSGYGGCGFAIGGRAEDMIVRNYFSHTICGSQNVFAIMQAYGLPFRYAGENIGWESGYTDPAQAASYLNTLYMNSPEHRANILNPNYTDVGVGSWTTAPGQVWTGGGGQQTDVFMSTEEFAQLPSASPSVATGPVAGPGPGYWLMAADGGVFDMGASGFYGSPGGGRLNQPVVGAASTPSRRGYWLVARDGGVFAYGDARFLGGEGGKPLNQQIVGMAATRSGDGYWLVASDGGVFSFGDAPFLGSMGGRPLNQRILSIAATPSGHGYWLIARDGGVFSFGDAAFHGSTGGQRLNAPIVGAAATPSGKGYWLAASDGGVFTFGDARFLGSAGNVHLNQPVVGLAASHDGDGYWLVAADGGIFTYGAAGYHGSTGGQRLNAPIVGMAAG